MNCCGPSRRRELPWAALAATVGAHYMLGTIADRNHTVVRDLSGLRLLS